MPSHSTSNTHRGWVSRLKSRRRLSFPCPACQRPIEIRKKDAGGELACPLCTALLVAPDPVRQSPARVRDSQFEAARQFQLQHERRLIDLKRGRLQSAVAQKQQRLEETAPSPSPDLPPLPDPRPFSSTVAPDSSTPPHEIPPSSPRPNRVVSPPHRAVKALTTKHLSGTFTPIDQVRIVPNADEDPLSWNSGDRENSTTTSRTFTPLLVAQILGAAALVALLLYVVYGDLENHQEKTRVIHTASEKARQHEIAQEQEELNHTAKVEAAVTAANAALGVPSWKDLLPHVRHAQRLAPMMQQYYASTPWRPRKITRVVSAQSKWIDGHEFLALVTEDSDAKRLALGLEKTKDGWKLDWEQYVPLHELEWDHFIKTRPEEPHFLRVSIIRRTPSPEQLLLSGVPEDKAFGIMLWCTDIARGTQQAILDEDSPIARKLADIISFDRGKRLILTLSCAPTPGGLRHDMVTVDDIITVGWTYLDETALRVTTAKAPQAPSH
jgi:hypothetical protein